MSILIDDPRLVFKRPTEAITPFDHATCLVNKWWCYVESRGLMFYRQHPKANHLSPQCNSNKDCAESVRARLYPWAVLKFFDVVYVHVDSEGRMS